MFENSDKLYFYFALPCLILGTGIYGALSLAIWRDSGVEKQARLERLVELTKWFFGSLALVIGAAIVANSFQERQQDVQEFAVFDKYVATILDAQGIEKRLLLADYFSLVAPPGELRDSWTRYRDHIKPQADQFRANKEELALLAQKPERTDEELKKIATLQLETARLNESLIETSQETRNWTIVAGTDVSRSEAEYELQKALGLSPRAQVYKLNNKFLTAIPGFKTFAEASTFLPAVKQAVSGSSYIVDLNSLCKRPSSQKDFTECEAQSTEAETK